MKLTSVKRIDMIEFERKFLLKHVPHDFETYIKSEVTQWYLKIRDAFSLRLRLYDDGRCYLDIKERKSGSSKQKHGRKVVFLDYEKYTINKPLIKKARYKKHFDGYLLIIDIFDDNSTLIEVECKDINLLSRFEPPDWFGMEVTDDIRYTNHYMAINKKPLI